MNNSVGREPSVFLTDIRRGILEGFSCHSFLTEMLEHFFCSSIFTKMFSFLVEMAVEFVPNSDRKYKKYRCDDG